MGHVVNGTKPPWGDKGTKPPQQNFVPLTTCPRSGVVTTRPVFLKKIRLLSFGVPKKVWVP